MEDLEEEIRCATRGSLPKNLFKGLDIAKVFPGKGEGYEIDVTREEEDLEEDAGRAEDFFFESECNARALQKDFPSRPFSVIAKEMEPVWTEKGKHLVLKKIITEGTGDKTPGWDDGLVFDYQEFIEGSELAVSSTEHSRKTHMSLDGLFPGFAAALMSMKAGEVAYFLIDYSKMYGELGCLPRIGPKQDILCEIELWEIKEWTPDNGETDDYFGLDKVSKVKMLKDEADGFYKKKNFSKCLKLYKQALRMLELMPKDDEDQVNAEIDKLKSALWLDLATVLNLMDKPSKALTYAQQILHIRPDDPSALWNCGRAQAGLNRILEARNTFKYGRAISSDSATVKLFEAELKKLERANLTDTCTLAYKI